MSQGIKYERFEQSGKEVQILFNDNYIVKTSNPLLVWERTDRPPQYYVPVDSIISLDTATEERKEVNLKTESLHHQVQARSFELHVGDKSTIYYVCERGPLEGFARFEHEDMDAWFEDGVLLPTFPKNPSRRIDTAFIAATIKVFLGDTLIAETGHAIRLYETGLPTRYYLPATSVLDWRILIKSTHSTACPYKGEARYFHLETEHGIQRNVVWYYPFPLSESAAIAGKLSFSTTDQVKLFVNDVEF